MDKHIETLIQRYPQLESCKEDILKAYQILEEAYSAGRKLLVAGNGGSASDSEHIVGELMKEFKLKRKILQLRLIVSCRLMQRWVQCWLTTCRELFLPFLWWVNLL